MATFVDRVAMAMPWAGSAIPAVMTFENVQKLGFEPWQAFIIGLVVEGIGFVSIATALDIYEANVAERLEKTSRPLFDGAFWVAVAGMTVYLVAVLLVNAILDDGNPWQKLTLALLSLFGVVGGVMVVLRNQLHKRLAASKDAVLERKQDDERNRAAAEKRESEEREHQWQMEQERLKLEHDENMKKIEADNLRKLEKIRADGLRKASAESPEPSGENPAVSGDEPVGHRRWGGIPESEYRWIADAPAGEIVKKYKLTGKDPERLARTWKKYAREGIKKLEVQ